MILRKLAGAIRKQDWFTVVLELTIVVVGIFLGLQAGAWNQARLDKEEADYHLNFLYEELAEEIVTAQAELEQSEVSLRNSFQASFLQHEAEWNAESEEHFRESVSSTFRLWGPKNRPVSLRRMIDDGKLDLLDRDLQRAILNYEAAYLDAIEQTRTSYRYSLLLTPQITASMRFRGQEIVSSPEELIANETLRAAVRDKPFGSEFNLM